MNQLRFANMLASAAVVAVSCAAIRWAPWQAGLFTAAPEVLGVRLRAADVLWGGAAIYTLLLAVYYAGEQSPSRGKSLRFWRVLARWARHPVLGWRERLSTDDRVAVLATLLKAFFAPLMAMSLLEYSGSALANAHAIWANSALWDAGWRVVFDAHGFWIAMQLILFVDVLIFTAGYMVELPRLGNQIRSVDPTILGWAAAIMCYAPFNLVTSWLLGSQVSDFPQFENPMAHVALNIALLTLMAAYSWASVALGWKASNLTHRGIIGHGPYRFVRHPAYICKNAAWWIASVPLVSMAFERSTWDGLAAIGSVIGWSAIYVLRALTEEDHLRSVDGEYAAYAARVRWRFVPGIA